MDAPRVQRSPLCPADQMFVFGGECFEDGKRRIIVPESTSEETVLEMIEVLESRDEDWNQLMRAADTIRRMVESTPNHQIRSTDDA